MHALQLVFSAVMLALLGSWLAYHAISAIVTGVARAAGASHRRSKRPVMFWLTVTLQFAFALVFFSYLTVRIIRQR